MPTITLELPDWLYQQAMQTAKSRGQPLITVLQDSIAQALPKFDDLPPQLAQDLAALPLLNDAALWRMAGKVLSSTEQRQLNDLLDKQQTDEPLTKAEQQQLNTLLEAYQQTMVIRAEAAVLLKRRGYDVSDNYNPNF